MVPRQNGKGSILEARELAGLFLLNEPLLIHSAQHFKTAKEHFLRVYGLIEGTPEFSRRVKKVTRTHGEEGIELHGGQRLLFFARTKSSGRGFAKAEFVAFDEAMFLPEATIGALLPTQAATPNRQRWYTGSAVDQEIHNEGVVFARVRERGIAGDDHRLAYFEYSADAEHPIDLDDSDYTDQEIWAEANPGLGIRIPVEAVEDEYRALDRRTFAVERLGVGDWPSTDPSDQAIISLEQWAALEDPNGRIDGPIVIAFDVSPERRCSVAIAGRNQEQLVQLEVPENRAGTGWVVEWLDQRDRLHEPAMIVCDGYGPASSLLHELEEANVKVRSLNATEHAQACGLFIDAVQQQTIRHLGSAELWSAVKGAAVRPLGDSWAWSRKNSTTDISPLVAVTLAHWAAEMTLHGEEEVSIF